MSNRQRESMRERNGLSVREREREYERKKWSECKRERAYEDSKCMTYFISVIWGEWLKDY